MRTVSLATTEKWISTAAQTALARTEAYATTVHQPTSATVHKLIFAVPLVSCRLKRALTKCHRVARDQPHANRFLMKAQPSVCVLLGKLTMRMPETVKLSTNATVRRV